MFAFVQMDTHLEMNAIKTTSSSFNVKDLLNLPGDKVSVAAAGELHHGATLASLPGVPDVTPPPPYYDADNPYTRWLQTNEHLHYSCKYPHTKHARTHTYTLTRTHTREDQAPVSPPVCFAKNARVALVLFALARTKCG